MLFILSVFQSCPINYDAFLLVDLDKVVHQTIENIYVGDTITHIALSLGLHNHVSHLAPLCGFNLLDIATA